MNYMKYVLLLIITITVLSHNTFAQCPQPGIKIVSATCEPPKNLKVTALSCSLLTVKWQGNIGQTYILNASYTDAAANTPVAIEGAKFSCDNNVSCVASVPVKEGTAVNWSVQSICSVDSVIFYSSKVNGPDAVVPACEMRRAIVKENSVHVYPNPAINYLMVQFKGGVTGSIEFKVFDIAGKKVYDKSSDGLQKTSNQYKLDLRNLVAGTYMLELHINNQISQTKFVLMKK